MARKKQTSNIEAWLYKGKPFDIDSEAIKQYHGFVYVMTNKLNGMKYIGKKSFWSYKTPKGAKRKVKVESNWRSYFSSSDEIKDYIKESGKENWIREIVYLCKEEKYMNYLEVKLQFTLGVLESEDWINNNINGLWYSSWVMGIEKSVDDYKLTNSNDNDDIKYANRV